MNADPSTPFSDVPGATSEASVGRRLEVPFDEAQRSWIARSVRLAYPDDRIGLRALMEHP